MPRRAIPMLLLLALCPALISAAPPDEAVPRQTAGDFEHERRIHARALNDRVRRAMQQPMGDVKFDEVGLAAALDLLRGATRLNLFVNWKALEAAGIERTTRVNVRLTGVSFAKVPDCLLKSASGDTVKVGYEVDEGVIMVSVIDDATVETQTRVYDVRDLVVFADAGNGDPEALDAKEERVEALTRMIGDTIDPDSWRDNGGSVGAIREDAGFLVVTQSEENQNRIENLLAHTRRLLRPAGAPER